MSSETSGLCQGDESAAEPSTDGKNESSDERTSPAGVNTISSDASLTPQQASARVSLTDAQLEEASSEQLRTLWRKQDIYISALESRTSSFEGEFALLRENEEKLKSQVSELALRERVLMRRLAAKEQDVQEYAGQLSEMKVPGGGTLKNTLLDPAVNVLVQRLRQELTETKTRLDDTQNELSAWKFTPDSNTGKRLMAKCRLLYQENEELGAMISKGRMAKLEGDLALQKSFSEEVKKSQSELDELLQDLDEDVEGMQSTIYFLQQELRKAKEAISNLQQENSILKRTESPEQQSPLHPAPNVPPIAAPSSVPVNGLSNMHQEKWCTDSLDSPSNDHHGGSSPSSPSRTKVNNDSDSVVNNNIVDGQQKRTSSESSGEAPVKKLRTDNSTSHYSDEELITNGSNDGQ